MDLELTIKKYKSRKMQDKKYLKLANSNIVAAKKLLLLYNKNSQLSICHIIKALFYITKYLDQTNESLSDKLIKIEPCLTSRFSKKKWLEDIQWFIGLEKFPPSDLSEQEIISYELLRDHIMILELTIKKYKSSNWSFVFRLLRKYSRIIIIFFLIFLSVYGFVRYRVADYPWEIIFYSNPKLSGQVSYSDRVLSLDEKLLKSLPKSLPSTYYSIQLNTCLALPTNSNLEFILGSDDGSRLYINNFLVVDNWQSQEYKESSNRITLPAGTHNLRIEYFELTGAAVLTLKTNEHDELSDWKKREFSLSRYLTKCPIKKQ